MFHREIILFSMLDAPSDCGPNLAALRWLCAFVWARFIEGGLGHPVCILSPHCQAETSPGSHSMVCQATVVPNTPYPRSENGHAQAVSGPIRHDGPPAGSNSSAVASPQSCIAPIYIGLHLRCFQRVPLHGLLRLVILA